MKVQIIGKEIVTYMTEVELSESELDILKLNIDTCEKHQNLTADDLFLNNTKIENRSGIIEYKLMCDDKLILEG